MVTGVTFIWNVNVSTSGIGLSNKSTENKATGCKTLTLLSVTLSQFERKFLYHLAHCFTLKISLTLGQWACRVSDKSAIRYLTLWLKFVSSMLKHLKMNRPGCFNEIVLFHVTEIPEQIKTRQIKEREIQMSKGNSFPCCSVSQCNASSACVLATHGARHSDANVAAIVRATAGPEQICQ